MGHFSLNIHSGVAWLGHLLVLFLDLEEPLYCYPPWLHQLMFPPTVYRSSPHAHQHFLLLFLLDESSSDGYKIIPHCGFNLNSYDDNDVEYLFMCLSAICISSLEKSLCKSFAHLYLDFFKIVV